MHCSTHISNLGWLYTINVKECESVNPNFTLNYVAQACRAATWPCMWTVREAASAFVALPAVYRTEYRCADFMFLIVYSFSFSRHIWGIFLSHNTYHHWLAHISLPKNSSLATVLLRISQWGAGDNAWKTRERGDDFVVVQTYTPNTLPRLRA